MCSLTKGSSCTVNKNRSKQKIYKHDACEIGWYTEVMLNDVVYIEVILNELSIVYYKKLFGFQVLIKLTLRKVNY